jgi:uncharacterized membrane protein
MANLVAIAYDDLGQARQVMGTVGELVREHSLTLDDAVIVERRPTARSSSTSPRSRAVERRAARFGAASSDSSS